MVDTDNAKDFQRLLRVQITSRHAKRPLNDTKDRIDNTVRQFYYERHEKQAPIITL